MATHGAAAPHKSFLKTWLGAVRELSLQKRAHARALDIKRMIEVKKKKILLVDLGAPMGGVEYYIETLSDMLRERAALVSLCVLPELGQRLRSLGVKVFLIPAFPRFKGLRYLLALGLLPIIILREQVQIVLVNGFLESTFLIPARLMGREAIYTRHGPFEDDLYKWYKNPARYFPRLMSRLCVRIASHVICVSHDVGKCVRKVVPEERTSVIPLWMPSMPPYNSTKGELTRPAHLLFVGRLERYKGLYLLLEALRGVPDVRLTVVGDGSYRKELERLAEGIDVRFEGFQPNPAKYYAEADIFVMPSLGPEGFGIVTMEAMAHGLPCITSDLAVNREVTGDGKAAMLFRNGNAEDLRDKLQELIGNASLRSAYSAAGYQRVRKVYTSDAALKSYLWAFGL
jgi:glycosyltransferase involved in cell wall biosynthesis